MEPASVERLSVVDIGLVNNILGVVGQRGLEAAELVDIPDALASWVRDLPSGNVELDDSLLLLQSQSGLGTLQLPDSIRVALVEVHGRLVVG